MDLPFLSKILNSEWRQRTSKRYPVLVANLEMSQSDVDVNLAPDKRSVLLKNRKYCEFRFKNVLESTWSGLEGGSSHEIVSLSQPPIDKFINNQKAERKSPEKSILEPESTDKENHNSEDAEFDGLVCTILTPGPRELAAVRTLDKPDKEKSIQKPIDDFLHDIAHVDSPIKISKQTENSDEQNFQKKKNIEDAKYFIKFEARESNTQESRDSEHDSDEIESNEQKSLNEESSRDLFKSESLSDAEESFEISGEKPEERVKEEFIDTQQTPNVENLHLETEYRSPLIEILTPNKSRSRNTSNVTSPTHKRPRLDPRLDQSADSVPFEPSGNPIGESTHLQESIGGSQLPEPRGTYNFSIEKLKSFHQRQSSKLRRVFKMLLLSKGLITTELY